MLDGTKNRRTKNRRWWLTWAVSALSVVVAAVGALWAAGWDVFKYFSSPEKPETRESILGSKNTVNNGNNNVNQFVQIPNPGQQASNSGASGLAGDTKIVAAPINVQGTGNTASVSVDQGTHNNQTFNSGNNSGVVGNSNTVTIINVWTAETSKGVFSSNGVFVFPSSGPANMEALKRLAATAEFKDALRPFAALGLTQPKPSGIGIPKDATLAPVSYSKLVQVGALNPNISGQSRLVGIAINRIDKQRPRWPMRTHEATSWANDGAQRTLVENAQQWIKTYHEEMVEVGILAP
jgi:hypothetical protein